MQRCNFLANLLGIGGELRNRFQLYCNIWKKINQELFIIFSLIKFEFFSTEINNKCPFAFRLAFNESHIKKRVRNPFKKSVLML